MQPVPWQAKLLYGHQVYLRGYAFASSLVDPLPPVSGVVWWGVVGCGGVGTAVGVAHSWLADSWLAHSCLAHSWLVDSWLVDGLLSTLDIDAPMACRLLEVLQNIGCN